MFFKVSACFKGFACVLGFSYFVAPQWFFLDELPGAGNL